MHTSPPGVIHNLRYTFSRSLHKPCRRPRLWNASLGQSFGQSWEPLPEKWQPRKYSTDDDSGSKDSQRLAFSKPKTCYVAVLACAPVEDAAMLSRATSGNGSTVAARVPLRLAVGPPKPLMTSTDKQAYQRELNTVTIGMSCFFC